MNGNRFCKKYKVGDAVFLLEGYYTRNVIIAGFNKKGYYISNVLGNGKHLVFSDYDVMPSVQKI